MKSEYLYDRKNWVIFMSLYIEYPEKEAKKTGPPLIGGPVRMKNTYVFTYLKLGKYLSNAAVTEWTGFPWVVMTLAAVPEALVSPLKVTPSFI